jgi:hypothetical protein
MNQHLREFLLISGGLLFSSLGLVVLGPRYLEDLPVSGWLVACAIVGLGAGCVLIRYGVQLSRRRATVWLTRTGVVAYGALTVSLVAALCYWGLHGSMNERGGVFWLVLFGIVVTFCVAAELLRRSGMPLFERAPHAS